MEIFDYQLCDIVHSQIGNSMCVTMFAVVYLALYSNIELGTFGMEPVSAIPVPDGHDDLDEDLPPAMKLNKRMKAFIVEMKEF